MRFSEVASRISERAIPKVGGSNAAGLVVAHTEAGAILTDAASAIRERDKEVKRVKAIVEDEFEQFLASQEEEKEAVAP